MGGKLKFGFDGTFGGGRVMLKGRIVGLTIVGLLAGAVGSAAAGVIVSFGAGSAVVTADRSAYFDAVSTGDPLWNYTEDHLNVFVDDVAGVGFDPSAGNGGFFAGFHYAKGGTFGATSISMADGLPFFAAEFNVGTGYRPPFTFFRYEAWAGGIMVGTAAFQLNSGTVLGFQSTAGGFDRLLIGSYQSLAQAQAATSDSYQAIAIDNLHVQLNAPASSVAPEPASLALIGSFAVSLVGYGWGRRGRQD